MHRLLAAVGAILFIGVRLHVLDDDLPNPDIAGILYNAEVWLDGGLPYVDTAEVKPPGSFLMVALVFAMLGRGLLALQLAHALWLLVGAAGVGLLCRELVREQDDKVRPVAIALGVLVYLGYAPMFTYNYSSWMMPAYAWAVAAGWIGLRRGGRGWPLLAGAAAMLAFLTIQRAVVLAALMPGLWAWHKRRDATGATIQTLVLWTVGAALMFLMWWGPYAKAGQTAALLAGVFPIDVALSYSAKADAGIGAIVVGAIGQLGTTFWMALVLVVLGIVAARSERARDSDVWILGGAWLAASIAGAAIGGGRFYVHYLVQYVPALAILAAHPALASMLLPREDANGTTKLVRIGVAAVIAAQLLEVGLGSGHRYEAKARRLQNGSTAAQAAGAHIRERTPNDARIAAWGWTAWRIYYWADRRAPGRIYKPLGTLTTFNSNTAFSPGSDIVLVDGARTAEYIDAWDAHPPAYFVYSPSFESTFGAAKDPLQSFGPLLERLEQDYVPEAAYGDLRLFRRRPPS